MDPGDAVRIGYDSISAAYLADRGGEGADIRLLAELERRLPPNSKILDLGCGAGVPVTARLAQVHRVVGIDFSEAQIELARKAVPNAEFRVGDMVCEDLGDADYDAAVSYYAIIHIPRDRHETLLAKIAKALKPEGLALLCLGAQDIEEDVQNDYYGHPMFWSHFDAQTYLDLLPRAGLRVIRHWLVADASCPEARHLFALCRRAADG